MTSPNYNPPPTPAPDKPTDPTLPIPHESQIPSITSTLTPHTLTTKILFSTCLLTTLSALKRLHWTQTPWLSPPLSPSIIPDIHKMLTPIKPTLNPQCLPYALYIGEPRHPTEAPNSRPKLYAVFLHLRRHVWSSKAMMYAWHNDVIAPAFNIVWEDSGLVRVVQEGVHAKVSRTAHKIVRHLEEGRRGALGADWPFFVDENAASGEEGGKGIEGKYSSRREALYDDAWTSMKGMLKDHPNLMELQDMFLIMVAEGEVEIPAGLSPAEKMQAAVEAWKWDFCVDSRYVVQGSFGVVCRQVVGEEVGGWWDDDDDDSGVDSEEWFNQRFKGVTIVHKEGDIE